MDRMSARTGIKALILVSIVLWFSACTALRQTKQEPQKADALTELREQIAYLIDDPNLSNAQIGIYIESLRNGRIIFKSNEHKLFMPASNMKLFTTAAGLTLLGTDFRYHTPVYAMGTRRSGVLNGDLVVEGKGDPTISGRYHEGDRFAIFKSWADSLKKHGIRTIGGDLIANNAYFPDNGLRPGWAWDDQPYYYAAQVNALTFNDNCVDLEIIPGGQPGDTLKVRQYPDINYLNILNRAVTVKKDTLADIDITRRRGENVVEITGSVTADSDTIFESITVEQPGYFFLKALQHVLQSEGIAIEGDIRVDDGYTLADTNRLFTHTSPDLAQIITTTNKRSHNLYAEQLLNTIGGIKRKEASRRAGITAVKHWLNGIGVVDRAFIMRDGSGLARKNLIAPYSTATLLRKMYFHPDFSVYYQSLPVAGVDGTLKRRMRGTQAKGNVHAKTGYVGHVRCLSGYVHDQNKNPYVFAIMLNHYSIPTPYVNELQDKICVLLSNFSH